ncbi:MAG: cyclic peptide export ABC transporter [Planctomycetales bacterium]|nr:cyclic peptide export ABC transporter [Planctomycetales bacterium]
MLLLRSSWVAGALSVLLGAVSGVASLRLVTLIHGALTQPESSTSWLPALFAGCCVVVLATQVASKCLLVRLSQSTAARLRFEMCTRIMGSPLPRLESIGQHRLLAALIGDVNAITGALTELPGVCASAMVLVCGLAYLASLSPPLAGCMLLGAALAVGSYLGGLQLANMHLRRARDDQDEVVKQLKSMISGIRELKGNNARRLDFFYNVLLPADSRMRHHTITGQSLNGLAHSWGRLTTFIGIGLLIFLWPKLWTVSAETMTGYVLTILYLTYPLDGILGYLPTLTKASISFEKLQSLGLAMDNSDDQSSGLGSPPFESLELCGVTHLYDAVDRHGFQLGPIDFQLAAGEALFIAGGNGSGKTTLAKLLTGLYTPQQGTIRLNGQVISQRSIGNYRQLFSTVFVEGHLFDRILGVEYEVASLRYWDALLGIEDKVDMETGRLRVGELSRGQHKRLALLVACLEDRPILVFDEWAAEQDPGFKEVFYHRILPELKSRGRTVVAITHDDRFFHAADRVVKLTDGRIDAAPPSLTAKNKAA